MPTYLAFALPAGLKGEMCIFECEDCGKRRENDSRRKEAHDLVVEPQDVVPD